MFGAKCVGHPKLHAFQLPFLLLRDPLGPVLASVWGRVFALGGCHDIHERLWVHCWFVLGAFELDFNDPSNENLRFGIPRGDQFGNRFRNLLDDIDPDS